MIRSQLTVLFSGIAGASLGVAPTPPSANAKPVAAAPAPQTVVVFRLAAEVNKELLEAPFNAHLNHHKIGFFIHLRDRMRNALRSTRTASRLRRAAIAAICAAGASLALLPCAGPVAAQEPSPSYVPRPGDALIKLRAGRAPVTLVSFSPDSTKLAVTVRSANSVYVYGVSDWKLQHILHGHRGACCRTYTLAFSPDSKLLAVAGMDDLVRVLEVESGTEAVVPGVTKRVIGAVFSPDGNVLATCGEEGVVTWDAHTGARLLTITADSSFDALAYSPDGKMIAGGGVALRIWHTADGHEAMKLANKSAATSLEFSPDGAGLAESEEEQVNLWSAATGELEKSISDPQRPGAKASAYVARTLTGPAWILMGLAADQAAITSQPAMFIPATESIAMVRDARLGGRPRREVVAYDRSKDAAHLLDLGFVISLSFSRDGKLVAAATDGGVKVWDADSGRQRH